MWHKEYFLNKFSLQSHLGSWFPTEGLRMTTRLTVLCNVAGKAPLAPSNEPEASHLQFFCSSRSCWHLWPTRSQQSWQRGHWRRGRYGQRGRGGHISSTPSTPCPWQPMRRYKIAKLKVVWQNNYMGEYFRISLQLKYYTIIWVPCGTVKTCHNRTMGASIRQTQQCWTFLCVNSTMHALFKLQRRGKGKLLKGEQILLFTTLSWWRVWPTV